MNEERGSYGSYAAGLIASIVLTAIPFALVTKGLLPRAATLLLLFASAVFQILVHLRVFLHLDASSGSRWNALSLIFAIMIMVLVVGGTIWIMVNLNYRLM